VGGGSRGTNERTNERTKGERAARRVIASEPHPSWRTVRERALTTESFRVFRERLRRLGLGREEGEEGEGEHTRQAAWLPGRGKGRQDTGKTEEEEGTNDDDDDNDDEW